MPKRLQKMLFWYLHSRIPLGPEDLQNNRFFGRQNACVHAYFKLKEKQSEKY